MSPDSTGIPPVLKLSIVVPVYRSEACLPALIAAITAELEPTGWDYETILVNDFSPDRSWQVMEKLCRQNRRVVAVDLRRNFGQDNAILTGMRLARGAYIVIMDDDLQHHPKYIRLMLDKAEKGADVVYADFDSQHQKLWKKMGSRIHGKIAEYVLYKPRNVYLSPYKIVRKEVADMICNFGGPTPYVDGLLYQVTWRISSVQVAHFPRHAGKGNYTFWRSLGVSARLIFSYSLKPLRLVTWTGLAITIVAVIVALGVTASRLLFAAGLPAEGIASSLLVITLLLVVGLQLTLFGIVGEYVGRIYRIVSEKPQTSIREILNRDCPVTSPSPLSNQVEQIN